MLVKLCGLSQSVCCHVIFEWLACIMKKKRKVFDPMGTSGSVTSLQLVQRDGLLQNTANYAFVP